MTKQQKDQERERLNQVEQMRQEVIERELRARYARANWEIMYYSMENEKLQPDYLEYVKREEERVKVQREEQQKKYEEFIKGIEAAKAINDAAKDSPTVEVVTNVEEEVG